jgi:hypothetical protein
VNIIMRMFVRKAVTRGMSAGIGRMAGGGKATSEMTPDERRAAQAAKKTARRAKQATKLSRRVGRF